MQIHIKKVRGSVLQYAVVTAVLIFFLVLSIILLTHIQSYFKLQSQSFLDDIANVDAQIEAALAKDFSGASGVVTHDSTSIKIDFLGAFQRVTAGSKIKDTYYKKSALIGVTSNKALYLVDNNKPLVLVGHSGIDGKAYLPSAGVKAGSIAGGYFYGTKLVDVPSYISTSSLPKLDRNFRNYIRAIQKSTDINENKIVPLAETIANSFLEDTKVIHNSNSIEISESLTGNITIISDTKVVVNRFSKLKDVTIVAPIVTVQQNFEGSIHIIASDSIIVKKNAALKYPSSLILHEKRNVTEQSLSAIKISEGVHVQGAVIYLKNTTHTKQQANIITAKNAMVAGAVYCEGNLELKGKVEGSVFTNQFITREKGSTYINHILDGKIENRETAFQYYMLPFENEKKEIARWLY